MKIFIGLLAVLDPVGAIPIVVAVTSGDSQEELKKIVNTVVISVLTILLTALFSGEWLLTFFGITINSFRVAGGILLMIMAISMLHGKISETVQTRQETREGEKKESVSLVPLSVPLLAGPGAISAVILYANRGTDYTHHLVMAIVIILVVMILWVVLAGVPWLSRHVSTTGINVFTRLMGLIIAALAVEFIANGLKGLFPVLAATN